MRCCREAGVAACGARGRRGRGPGRRGAASPLPSLSDFPGQPRLEVPGAAGVAEMSLRSSPALVAISASQKLNDFSQGIGARERKAQRQKCLQGSSQFSVRVARRSCTPAPTQRCHFKRTRAFLSEATAVLCTVGFQ